MKNKNYLTSLLVLCFAVLSAPVSADAQGQEGKTGEIESLRNEIREIKRMREQSDVRMRAIERRLDELTGGKSAEQAEPVRDAADSATAAEAVLSEKPEREAESPFRFDWSGYSDIRFSYFDHGPNQNRPGGSESDDRLEFDLARFVVELEGETDAGLGFEAEIEFEHGGTGSAFEIEYEEFGEFEQEVENGGEVYLEELYLWKRFGDWGKIRAGRFYLGFGLLYDMYKPTEYLAAARSESETMVIPAVWDEMGIGFNYYASENLELVLQVVNGLDSSGFGSLNWVGSGHQGKFETIRADGLAFVGRVDFKLPDIGFLIGSSVYYGLDTNANRPKRGLEDVDSPLLLLDAHMVFRYGKWHATGMAMWGRLWNADDISERNRRLSNNLNAPRTPVGDNALATWAELGYDVGSFIGLGGAHSLKPFFRVDYYDTMFRPRESLFDNPRYERLVLTSGLSYVFSDSAFVKLDYSHRRVGDSNLNNEGAVNLSLGWVY